MQAAFRLGREIPTIVAAGEPVLIHLVQHGAVLLGFSLSPRGRGDFTSRRNAAVGRADGGALRAVELALALGALGRVDDVGAFLQADRDVRALGLAGAADGAFGGLDLVGHGSLLR
ncbi:hypothetical protein GCM10007856_56710 [Azospirillum oryzae]|nr:hypothetical protein GCM10007856_56710 [Azospirillum oryzae]